MPSKSTAPAKPQRNTKLAMAIAATGDYLYVVAGRARIGPRLLSGYVRGTEQPTPAVQERIAAALDVQVHEIFEDA